jgi:3-methylcrotonyl-CoA carboxylase alpha subunit
MLAALAAFRIVGVGNNLRFLSRLIAHPEFRAGQVDTGLIEREREVLLAPAEAPSPMALAAAALWLLREEGRQLRAAAAQSAEPHSPWTTADGWRMNSVLRRRMVFRSGETEYVVSLAYDRNGILIDGASAEIDDPSSNLPFAFSVGARRERATAVLHGEQVHVFLGAESQTLRRVDPLAHAGESQDAHGGMTAPMPGRIVALLASVGAEVERGAPLLVMEAMKMEHTLCAPAKGRVREFLCSVNDQVGDGRELIDFEAIG